MSKYAQVMDQDRMVMSMIAIMMMISFVSLCAKQHLISRIRLIRLLFDKRRFFPVNIIFDCVRWSQQIKTEKASIFLWCFISFSKRSINSVWAKTKYYYYYHVMVIEKRILLAHLFPYTNSMDLTKTTLNRFETLLAAPDCARAFGSQLV